MKAKLHKFCGYDRIMDCEKNMPEFPPLKDCNDLTFERNVCSNDPVTAHDHSQTVNEAKQSNSKIEDEIKVFSVRQVSSGDCTLEYSESLKCQVDAFVEEVSEGELGLKISDNSISTDENNCNKSVYKLDDCASASKIVRRRWGNVRRKRLKGKTAARSIDASCLICGGNVPSQPKFIEHLINRVVSKRIAKACNNGLIMCDDERTVLSDEEPPLSPDSEKCLQHAEAIVEELLAYSVRPASVESTNSDQGSSLVHSTNNVSPTQKKTSWSNPVSPTFSGIVNERLRTLQSQKGVFEIDSQPMPTVSSVLLQKTESFKKSDFELEIKEINNSIKNFYTSILEDEDFRLKVMASGYVKTLVAKINENKFQICDEKNKIVEVKDNGCSNEHIVSVPGLLTKPGQMDPKWKEWEKENSNNDESDNIQMPNSIDCMNNASEAGSLSEESQVSIHRSPRTATVASSSLTNSPKSSCANSFCDIDSHVRTLVQFNQEHCKSAAKSHSNSTVSSLYSCNSSHSKFSSKLCPPKLCASARAANAYVNTNGAIVAACTENRNCMLSDVQGTSEQTADRTGTNDKQGSVSQSFDCGVSLPNLAELFDQHWSKTELSFDDLDCNLDGLTNSKLKDKDEIPKDRLHQIAYELLTTERTYVEVLYLLDQVFQARVLEENKTGNFLPPEIIPQMFANIRPIYTFHQAFLLPDLEERMKNWLKEKKIGDILAKLAPFLKLYTDYVKNYDNAMSLLDKWTSQTPKFAALLQEIQKMPVCKQLTLQHHMLGPIQRIPRYEMLLKDYLKRLEPDAPDRPDAQKALDLVTQAACHSNTAMEKLDKFNKLLSIIPRLNGEGANDLVSPTRELIKEGSITKISARSGEKQARYLFLFNDLLLVCSEQITGSYKLRARLSVDGMQTLEGENKIISITFCVQCTEKTIEFLDDAINGNGLDWYATFQNVIADFQKRKMGRVVSVESDLSMIQQSHLGLIAPKLVQDVEVTMCMGCHDKFTALKRKQHCRACGKVFCSSCTSQKVCLKYGNNRVSRVCQKCYKILTMNETNSLDGGDSTSPWKQGVVQVFADEASVLASYLNVMDKGRNWARRWITVRDDFAMYFYKKSKNPKALQTLHLPGHVVKIMGSSHDRANVFSLTHKDTCVCYFQADNEVQMNHWVHTIEKLIKLELPSEEDKRLSTNSVWSSQSSSSSGQSVQS